MNNLACVKGILKGATALTDAELDKIIKDMAAKKRVATKASGGTGGAQAASQIAEREAARLRMEAAIQKRNAAENAIKRRALLDQRANYRSISEWAEAMATPSNRDVAGARDSATAKQEGYVGKYAGGFIAAMDREGLLPYVATRLRDLVDPRRWGKGPLDDKIAEELWELTAEGGKPGLTGSVEALKIARIVHQFQELARGDLNRLGAFIGKIPGYIVAQSHDMSRIARVSFEEWRAIAERTFGNDRTYEKLRFTGDEAKDAELITNFWRRIHYELSTGEHFSASEGKAESGFKGPANEAKRLSQHRVLHPNTAKDWIAYNDQFGASSLMEAVLSGFQRAGKSAGLMEKFGTNPRAAFEGMIADARDFDMKQGKPIDKRIAAGGFTSRLFDVVDGTADIPARLSVAKLGSAVRAYQSITKLGGAVLASLPDTALSAARIRDTHGDNLLSAVWENIGTRIAQWGDGGKQREAAMLMHVGIDSILRDIASRVTSADSVNWKWANKSTNAFFKLNLLGIFTDSGERAAAAMHNVRTAAHRDTAHGNLPQPLKDELARYGIGEREWEVIRKHARHDHDGTPMLLGDKLRDMPPDKIDDLVEWPLEAIRIEGQRGLDQLQKRAEQVDTKIERLTETVGKQGELGQTVADLRAMRDFIKGFMKADVLAKRWNVDAEGANAGKAFSSAKKIATEQERIAAQHRAKIGTTVDKLKKAKKAEPGVLDALAKAEEAIDELRAAIAEWPERLDRQLARRRELAVQELESKWHTFTIGQVHGGVIRGTAREKAYATQGLQAGTPAGEAFRMIMQFKQYPMAFVQQVLGRYAQEDKFWSIPVALAKRMAADPGGTGAKVASLVTMLTVMGYLSMALKDVAKGRTPRDPRDPNTWGAAFVQGGGAGLYGDYLFARTNRFGGSILESAVGPTIGQAGEAADLLLGSRDAILSDVFGDGSKEYPDAKAFTFFKNSTPFLNLFYTRAALDYLIFYDIQEALSPGSLRRMERRLKDEQGQEFILPPSDTVN